MNNLCVICKLMLQEKKGTKAHIFITPYTKTLLPDPRTLTHTQYQEKALTTFKVWREYASGRRAFKHVKLI